MDSDFILNYSANDKDGNYSDGNRTALTLDAT